MCLGRQYLAILKVKEKLPVGGLEVSGGGREGGREMSRRRKGERERAKGEVPIFVLFESILMYIPTSCYDTSTSSLPVLHVYGGHSPALQLACCVLSHHAMCTSRHQSQETVNPVEYARLWDDILENIVVSVNAIKSSYSIIRAAPPKYNMNMTRACLFGMGRASEVCALNKPSAILFIIFSIVHMHVLTLKDANCRKH